jgi:hypothetical protein
MGDEREIAAPVVIGDRMVGGGGGSTPSRYKGNMR